MSPRVAATFPFSEQDPSLLGIADTPSSRRSQLLKRGCFSHAVGYVVVAPLRPEYSRFHSCSPIPWSHRLAHHWWAIVLIILESQGRSDMSVDQTLYKKQLNSKADWWQSAGLLWGSSNFWSTWQLQVQATNSFVEKVTFVDISRLAINCHHSVACATEFTTFSTIFERRYSNLQRRATSFSRKRLNWAIFVSMRIHQRLTCHTLSDAEWVTSSFSV